MSPRTLNSEHEFVPASTIPWWGQIESREDPATPEACKWCRQTRAQLATPRPVPRPWLDGRPLSAWWTPPRYSTDHQVLCSVRAVYAP